MSFLPPGQKPVFGQPPPTKCGFCGYPFDRALKKAHFDVRAGLWVCNALYACSQRVILDAEKRALIAECVAEVAKAVKESAANAARVEALPDSSPQEPLRSHDD